MDFTYRSDFQLFNAQGPVLGPHVTRMMYAQVKYGVFSFGYLEACKAVHMGLNIQKTMSGRQVGVLQRHDASYQAKVSSCLAGLC